MTEMLDSTAQDAADRSVNETPPKANTANISDAVERIYRKYGSDLSHFFSDVEEEISVKKQELRGSRLEHSGSHAVR